MEDRRPRKRLGILRAIDSSSYNRNTLGSRASRVAPIFATHLISGCRFLPNVRVNLLAAGLMCSV